MGFSLSGCGADAINVINGKTNAYINGSTLNDNGLHDVTLKAEGKSTIKVTVAAVSVVIGFGSKNSVGAAIGASISRNLIGWDDQGNANPLEVQSYITASTLSVTGNV